jgi:hypothetical protein
LFTHILIAPEDFRLAALHLSIAPTVLAAPEPEAELEGDDYTTIVIATARNAAGSNPEDLQVMITGLAQLSDFYHKAYRDGVIARRHSRRSNPYISKSCTLLDCFLLRSAQSQ